MKRLFLLAALAASPLCLAQGARDLFDKAPPDVDRAVRARIGAFYQTHVAGKFSAAMAMVADDSKDAFMESRKERCRSFEIVKLTYSDKFTRARALVTCDTDFVIPPGAKVAVKMPLTSFWKLAGNEWFWYLDEPKGEVASPFGKMKMGVEGAPGSAPPPAMAAPEVAGPAVLKEMAKGVSLSKQEVTLTTAGSASVEVTVSNNMPGHVSLVLDYASFPGFEAVLDRTRLGPKESARLTLRIRPADRPDPQPVVVNVRVEPIGKVLPLRVTFVTPPGIERPQTLRPIG